MRFTLYLFLLLAAPALADVDADFLAANDAFRAKNISKLKILAPRLKNTPLRAYVEYYQLSITLENADAKVIRQFLNQHEDNRLLDQLRGEWLKVLGKQQQWALFDEEYPLLLNEDTEVTCYSLQLRLLKRDQYALREARSLWFSGKRQPESCNIPFEAAISAGVITQQNINHRLRLALESGNVSLAKQLSTRLKGDSGISQKAIQEAASGALRYLKSLKLDDFKALSKIRKNVVKKDANKSDEVLEQIDVNQGIYQTAGYSFKDMLSTENKVWHANFATGCLKLVSEAAVVEFPLSNFPEYKPQGKNSFESNSCRNTCGIFSLSARIMRQNSKGESLISLSGMNVGNINVADVDLMLANVEPIVDIHNAGREPSNDATLGWLGWRELLARIGLGIVDDSEMSETGIGSSVPSLCDPCTIAGEASTLTPMEWNPKLASEGQRTIVLFALQRLAKQSLDIAAARWEKIAPYFPAPEQHYLYGWLAYEAAREQDERALKWYKAAANTPLNERQLAWWVRAALRAQDWTEVLKSVNAMNEQQQTKPAWQYWKARALQTTGSTIEARKLFLSLSNENGFYGLLANEELAGTPVFRQAAVSYGPDEQAIEKLLATPGVQRTIALYRMGMRNEALEEWRWVVFNLNDRELITAAEIARRHEMYDRAIGAADLTVRVHDFSLRYLAPYRDILQEYINEHGLEEAWVYGLMRQESRFVSSAKSSAGAAGLMQIMPATARWLAKKLRLKSYRESMIHQLETNLRLGTYYMKTILSQFDDSPVMATAAYNAGPRRARQWLNDKPMEGAIYAESIPFDETRDYVKKVMSNTMFYARQFNTSERTFKQRLGIVPGKK